jgi:hypothetical protein
MPADPRRQLRQVRQERLQITRPESRGLFSLFRLHWEIWVNDMKLRWKIDEVQKSGILGSSAKFKIWIKTDLDAEEQKIVSAYSAYCPNVLDEFKISDYDRDKLQKKLGFKKPPFADAFEFEFDSIHQANNFRRAAVATLQEFKDQIEITKRNVAELGKLHEVEISEQ